eukprot:Nitzschia sp. Nitz4//scaffold36_size144017//11696//13447//NITZ4_003065-RA/size144017-processed-gene-0.30-mRNA-1//1//CDS//3329549393//5487//frame0
MQDKAQHSEQQQQKQQHHHQHQQDQALPENVLLGRRDKRRHLTPNSVDLRDPYAVLSLGIRVDEAAALAEGKDTLLRVPLESARLYNPQAFLDVLQRLQHQTSVPSTSSSTKQEDQNSSSNAQSPTTQEAVTPVLLSGLIAAIQQDPSLSSSFPDDDPSTTSPTDVELIAYCRSMRRAALSRVRLLLRRRRVQRSVTPWILLALVLGLLVWIAHLFHAALFRWRYHECTTYGCRLAAARLWDHAHSFSWDLSECTVDHCPLHTYYGPLYAMHTILHPPFLPLAELDRPRMVPSTYYAPPTWNFTLQWLGETVVHQQIRSLLPEQNSFGDSNGTCSSSPSMLDIGCGGGGSWYALQDSFRSYHGVGFPMEVEWSRETMQAHLSSSETVPVMDPQQVTFEKSHFETAFQSSNATLYSLVLGLESLAHVANLSEWMRALVDVMEPHGRLVVVEDILAPWVSPRERSDLQRQMSKPSLVTLNEWTQLAESIPNLQLEIVRDLGLEMDLHILLQARPNQGSQDWRAWGAMQLEQFWTHTMGRSPQGGVTMMLRLVQDLVALGQANIARSQAYVDAQLSYYMLVFRKVP